MAENKKSFIFYCDWKETFDTLPDEKAGQLIKHIISYVSDENPESNDILINAVFANIKQTLKRDLKKWESQQLQRIEAGKRSAESRKRKSTTVQRPFNDRSTKNKEDKQTSTVNVNDNVNVNNKNILEQKQLDFKTEVKTFSEKYDMEILKDFYNYWSEPTKKKDKMRKDLQKTWDTSRRLSTWFNRSNYAR